MTGLLEVLGPYAAYLALFVRVWVGANFIGHSRLKLRGKAREGALQGMKGMGIPAAAVTAATTLELVGGIFLLVGFIVPVVAILFAIEMLSTSALRKTKMKNPYLGGYELDMGYFVLAIVLIVLGAGALSVDQFLGL